MVGLQQTLRVRHATLRVEVDAIDDIAPVSRQRHAIDGFVTGRAGLGELAGHAPYLDHRTAGREGHDDRHLQQHLEGVANLGGREFGETLGAIAALQQERAALGHLGELPSQLPCFAGEDQRWQAGQGAFNAREVFGIRVFGLLLDRLASPAIGAPGVVHDRSN